MTKSMTASEMGKKAAEVNKKKGKQYFSDLARKRWDKQKDLACIRTANRVCAKDGLAYLPGGQCPCYRGTKIK